MDKAVLCVAAFFFLLLLLTGTVAADDEDVSSSNVSTEYYHNAEAEININQSYANKGDIISYEVDAEFCSPHDEVYIKIDEDVVSSDRVFEVAEVDDIQRSEHLGQAIARDRLGPYCTTSGNIDTTHLQGAKVDIKVSDYLSQVDDRESIWINHQVAQWDINSPEEVYVPGNGLDHAGSVGDHMGEVAVFVLGTDMYYHVTNMTVDEYRDTYNRTDFKVVGGGSDVETESAKNLLTEPGEIGYGIADLSDVVEVVNEPGANSTNPFGEASKNGGLDPRDFSSIKSKHRPLEVAGLENDVRKFNGEVFVDDGATWTAELYGSDEYVIAFIGSDGNTVVESRENSNQNRIESGERGITGLSSGPAEMYTFGPGPDGFFGNGTFLIDDRLRNEIVAQDSALEQFSTTPPSTFENFVRIADAVGELNRTQRRVRETLLNQTVAENNDDLSTSDSFRITTESRVEITDVVPAQLTDNVSGIAPIELGENMFIGGTTNRNPDEATIVVEATEGPSLAELGVGIDDVWNDDHEPDGGEWGVDIQVTEQVEPGNYTIEADDGEVVDEVTVEVFNDTDLPQIDTVDKRGSEILGGVVTINISASDVHSVKVESIPSSWNFSGSQDDSASVSPNGNGGGMSENGSVEWAWSANQPEVNTSVTFDIPETAQAGYYDLTVKAEGQNSTATETLTLSVEDCQFDPVVCNYSSRGTISSAELQTAVGDFISDDIELDDLQAVIDGFVSN